MTKGASLRYNGDIELPVVAGSLVPSSERRDVITRPVLYGAVRVDPVTVSSQRTLTLTLLGDSTITFVKDPNENFTLVSPVDELVFSASPFFTEFAVYLVSSILDVVQLEPTDIPPPVPVPPVYLVSLPSRFAERIPIPVLAAVVHSDLLSCHTPDPSTAGSSLFSMNEP